MKDYEEDHENECPKCDQLPTHYRNCGALHCENGFVDLWEDDPINHTQGVSVRTCDECYGSTIEEWCPKCSYDISVHKYVMKLEPAPPTPQRVNQNPTPK